MQKLLCSGKADIANVHRVQALSSPASATSKDTLASSGLNKKRDRKPCPGGSANYIRKFTKGRCQYILRIAHGNRKKGTECGRLGKIRGDGSYKCYLHFKRSDQLLKARIKHVRARLQRPEAVERIKERMDIYTEELSRLESPRITVP